MNKQSKQDERIANMTFSSVYPHYVNKVEKKGRTIEELHQIITWLTGFDDKKIQQLIDQQVTFKEFFKQAKLNPKARLIKGVVCGIRVEEIRTRLTRKCRYMDKMIDELTRGRKMEKILRK